MEVLDFLKVFFMCMHGCSMGPCHLSRKSSISMSSKNNPAETSKLAAF